MFNANRWNRLTGFLVAITLMFITTVAPADEPLRWQLSAGDELKYEINKSAALSLGDGSSKYELEQIVNVTWRVVDVNGDTGTASMEQTVDRIRLQLDDPLGEVRYDSDVDEEPGSLAALAATVFSAMLEHKIEFKLTPVGKIEDVKIPQPLLEAAGNVSFAKSLDRFASDEGLRMLLIPRLPAFPEGELHSGQEWIDEGEQLSGKYQVEVTYRYAGEKEQEGGSLAVVETTRHVKSEGDNTPLEIGNQQSSGEMLFNREQGRLNANAWKIELEVVDAVGESSWLKQEFRMELAR